MNSATTQSKLANRGSLLRVAIVSLPVHVVLRGGEALLPVLLGAWFGRSSATDTFYQMWASFQLIGSLVFAAYHDSAIIPVLTETRRNSSEILPSLIGSLLVHTVSFGAAVAAVAAGTWWGISHASVSAHLVTTMLLPFALFVVATGVRSLFNACLQSLHCFFAGPTASAVGMGSSLAIIALAHRSLGVAVVPMALLAGECLAVAVLAWHFLLRRGGSIHLCLSRPAAFWRFVRLAGSEVAGGAITRINPVTDQFVAALTAIAGAGTLLRYSLDVALVPTSILQAVLFPVLLAKASTQFADHRYDEFLDTVRKTLVTVCALLVGASLALAAVRMPLLKFVFLRGNMDLGGVRVMADIMPYHLIGLMPFGALITLARAHSAMGNSQFFWKLGVINASLNLVLDLILVRPLGLPGVALATSLVHAAMAALMFRALIVAVRRIRQGANAAAGPGHHCASPQHLSLSAATTPRG